MKELRRFIPNQELGGEVELQEELFPVIERISQIIPDELVWELFASSPSETGGRIVFPYSRVDSAVITASDGIYLSKLLEKKGKWKKSVEWYDRSSRQAFEALLWVEVGFGGLENLANSPASTNWTSGVGHFVNAQERAQGIMKSGKQMFDEKISDFVEFRGQKGIEKDIFTQYEVEYLLDPYRQQVE
jgi:hypothetical protein